MTGEDEIRIGLRFVIDQEIRFAAVEPCFGKLIFYGNTVDGEAAAVGEDGLYTVGIEIKATITEIHNQSSFIVSRFIALGELL